MKKVLVVAAALMFASSGVAMAGWGSSSVVNSQEQTQDDGNLITPSPTKIVAGSWQKQEMESVGETTRGFTFASDHQSQNQHQVDGRDAGEWDLGTSDYVGTDWSSHQNQNAFGFGAFDGDYSYEAKQGQIGGAAAINDGEGTKGIAGSGYAGFGKNSVSADGFAMATSHQNQSFDGKYQVLNKGSNGEIYQTGSQSNQTWNHASAYGGYQRTSGYGCGNNRVYSNPSSSVVLVQVGGTAATNDGQGTSMKGGGAAVSYGSSTGNAGFSGTQTHSYKQYNQSTDGTSWQNQSGTVTTSVGVWEK